MSIGQKPAPFSLEPISAAALRFVQAGLPLARTALGKSNAIALSDAKQRGIISEKCEFAYTYMEVKGITVAVANCPDRESVVMEVIASSNKLPAEIAFGMSTNEIISRLGSPSADRAKMAAFQGRPNQPDENTELYYCVDPSSIDAWAVELQIEGGKLTGVRWILGSL